MNRCVSDHCCYLPMIGYSSRKCPPHSDLFIWTVDLCRDGENLVLFCTERQADSLFMKLMHCFCCFISLFCSRIPLFPPPLPSTGCCSEFSQAKVVFIEMRSLRDGATSLCIYSHVCVNWSKSLFEPQNGALNVKWGLKSAWTNL